MNFVWIEIEHSMPSAIRIIFLVFLLVPVRAWGWGNDGHKIVAVVAADNLTPAAQSHVASILRVPANHTSDRDGSSLHPAGFGVSRRRPFDETLAFHRHLSERLANRCAGAMSRRQLRDRQDRRICADASKRDVTTGGALMAI